MTNDDLVLEPDEVAFWQAALAACIGVLRVDDTWSLKDNVQTAAQGADEAVRQLRRRKWRLPTAAERDARAALEAVEGGPGPAGTDLPKDALHEPCCCGRAPACANIVILPDGTLRDCCARCGGLLPPK